MCHVSIYTKPLRDGEGRRPFGARAALGYVKKVKDDAGHRSYVHSNPGDLGYRLRSANLTCAEPRVVDK